MSFRRTLPNVPPSSRPRGRGSAWPGETGCCRLLAAVVVFAVGAAPLSAAPLKLTNGQEIEIVELKHDGGKIEVTTDRGVVIPLSRDKIQPPRAAWMALVDEYRAAGKFDEAVAVAVLLRSWDPSDEQAAGLAGSLQDEKYASVTRDFQQALARGDSAAMSAQLAAAASDEHLIETLRRSLSAEARRAAISLTAATAPRAQALLAVIESAAPDIPELATLRRRLDELGDERKKLAEQVEEQDRAMREAGGFQLALQNALRYSEQGDYARASESLKSLGAPSQDHPDVRRVREVIDRAEGQRLKAEALATVDDAIRTNLYGRAMRSCDRALALVPGDRDILALKERISASYKDYIAQLREGQDPFYGARLATARKPDHTYQVYLPKDMDGSRRVPAMFGFSASGTGTDVVNQWRTVADHYGFMIVVSNNAKRGRWSDILTALDTLVDDATGRFLFDRYKRFATGYAGGADYAIALASRHPSSVFGLVVQQSARPEIEGLDPVTPIPVVFLYAEGNPQFDMEIPNVAAAYRGLGMSVEVWTFGGGALPPPPTMARAVDWLYAQWANRDMSAIDPLAGIY